MTIELSIEVESDTDDVTSAEVAEAVITHLWGSQFFFSTSDGAVAVVTFNAVYLNAGLTS